MKAMSKFWTALVVGGLVMVSTVLSWAGPLLPSFPDTWAVGQAVAGESTLTSVLAQLVLAYLYRIWSMILFWIAIPHLSLLLDICAS
jgi:hypothetical protein